MRFWEDCIIEIVREETQKRIEMRFGEKVADILLELEYIEENEKLINVFHLHYPLYKHGQHLVKKGWDLFYNASHPFVKSTGTSILNRGDDKTQSELMAQLKQRIEDFEKQTDESDKTLLNFLFQNNNNFVLHFLGRQKLADFNFALTKIKSGKTFLQFLAIWYIRYILSLLKFRDVLGIIDFQDIRSIIDLRDIRNILDLRDIRDILNIVNFRDILGIQYSREIQYIPYITRIFRNYNKEYKSIFKKHQREIFEWTDRAIEKLHGLADNELLKYFPNTTKEELKAFRDSYVQVIASELSKGNCDILKGKKLTKKKQAQIEKLVTFDSKSVERMLDFVLDTQHEEEKHAHHLKAFEILGNKDYEKLHKIIRSFIPSHPDDRIRLNALYIFKKMLEML